MIDWHFPDPVPFVCEVGTISVPIDEDFDDSWIYKRYQVVVRFVCEDGCIYVIVSKDY